MRRATQPWICLLRASCAGPGAPGRGGGHQSERLQLADSTPLCCHFRESCAGPDAPGRGGGHQRERQGRCHTVDFRHDTPLTFAMDQGHHEVEALLRPISGRQRRGEGEQASGTWYPRSWGLGADAHFDERSRKLLNILTEMCLFDCKN